MAAGLTIMEKDLPVFTVAFEEAARAMMPREALDLVIDTDGSLNPGEIGLDLAREIKSQVWGQGFPEPLFQGEFEVIRQRQVGKNEEHAKLTLGVDGVKFDAILFHQKDPLPDKIKATYALSINDFGGVEKVDLRLQRFQDMDTPVYVHQTNFVKGPGGLDL